MLNGLLSDSMYHVFGSHVILLIINSYFADGKSNGFYCLCVCWCVFNLSDNIWKWNKMFVWFCTINYNQGVQFVHLPPYIYPNLPFLVIIFVKQFFMLPVWMVLKWCVFDLHVTEWFQCFAQFYAVKIKVKYIYFFNLVISTCTSLHTNMNSTSAAVFEMFSAIIWNVFHFRFEIHTYSTYRCEYGLYRGHDVKQPPIRNCHAIVREPPNYQFYKSLVRLRHVLV